MTHRVSMNRYAAILGAVLACLGALAGSTARADAGGKSIYVAPGGDDANPGTLQAPLRSLEKARDTARQISPTADGDIHIVLRGGWHVLTKPLDLTGKDSGVNGHRIVYEAQPGEKPVLSGGKSITGWSLHDPAKKIWKVPAPGLNTRQLFVNGTRAARAHLGSAPEGWVKTKDGFKMPDNRMASWRNPSDIELIFNAGQGGVNIVQWQEYRCGIERMVDTEVIMKMPCWRTVSYPAEPGLKTEIAPTSHLVKTPTDIENAYELLDQPGEWYLDRTGGVIYYMPLPGQDLRTTHIVAPVLESLLVAKGTADEPVHDIDLKGITFAHTTWMLPSTNEGLPLYQANVYWYSDAGNDSEGGDVGKTGNQASLTVSAWATTYDKQSGFAGSAVKLLGAHNIRIERCHFIHLGGAGLAISLGSKDVTVEGSVFNDISDNAVRVGNVRLAKPENPGLETRRIRIANCYIHHVACEYRSGLGIMTAYAADLQILHNEIAHVPYSPMSVGWGWERVPTYAGNYEIAYNNVHDYMESLSDGGAIYLTGVHAKIHHNYCHDVGRGAGIRRALYPDWGSGWMDFHSNVCARVGTGEGGEGGAVWWGAWVPQIHDITIHDNFTDTDAVLNNGTNCTFSNNHLVKDGAWPEAARAIMAGAGVEPAYRDILSMEDPCNPK